MKNFHIKFFATVLAYLRTGARVRVVVDPDLPDLQGRDVAVPDGHRIAISPASMENVVTCWRAVQAGASLHAWRRMTDRERAILAHEVERIRIADVRARFFFSERGDLELLLAVSRSKARITSAEARALLTNLTSWRGTDLGALSALVLLAPVMIVMALRDA